MTPLSPTPNDGASSLIWKPEEFATFVRESNRIEGIRRHPTWEEVEAHSALLSLDHLDLEDVTAFVRRVAGVPIRDQAGMDVRVGDHRPTVGGPHVSLALRIILSDVNAGKSPYRVHLAYETLHPFMDGNGRSGRAIWLWQMLHQKRSPHVLQMGFLHLFYYQALQADDERAAAQIAHPSPNHNHGANR